MYRIEVRPGEETVFRNIEELATGIRNGFITPRARIYHAASQKWLPIEFHPHYKKALAGDYTPAPAAPQPSLSAMPTPVLTPVPAPAPSAIIAMRAAVEAPRATTPTFAEPWVPAGSMQPVEPEPAAELKALQALQEPETAAEPEEPPRPEPVKRHRPVEVFESVRPDPVPDLVLPKITYPEVQQTEEPVELPTARRSRRMGGRPLLLIGSAAALVLGAQLFFSSRSASVGEAEVAPEPAPAREEPKAIVPTPTPARAPARAPAPVAPAPARATRAAAAPAVPMTPGPAFAPSVPTRLLRQPENSVTASPRQPSVVAPAPVPPAAAAPAADPGIEPAPAAIELDLPAIPASDSLAPSSPRQSDSLALKRILKAVTAKKPVPLPGQ